MSSKSAKELQQWSQAMVAHQHQFHDQELQQHWHAEQQKNSKQLERRQATISRQHQELATLTLLLRKAETELSLYQQTHPELMEKLEQTKRWFLKHKERGETLAAQNQQLQQQLAETETRLAAQQAALEQQQQVKQQLESQLQSVHTQLQQQQAAYAEAEHKRQLFFKSKQRWYQQWRQSQHTLKQAMKTNQQFKQSQQQLHQEIQHHVIQRSQQRAKLEQHQQLQQSWWWRLGAPLRWLQGFVQRQPQSHWPQDIAALQQSGLFDEAFYQSLYPDVQHAGMPAIVHYYYFGGFEARWPNPEFDSGWYLRQYPDVRQQLINPLLHYVVYGQQEGRGTKA